jgi:hypothetical protein
MRFSLALGWITVVLGVIVKYGILFAVILMGISKFLFSNEIVQSL